MKVLSIKDDKITTKGELIEYPSELIGGRNYIKGGDVIFTFTPNQGVAGSSLSIVKKNIVVEPNTAYTLSYLRGDTTKPLTVYSFSGEPTNSSHNGYWTSPFRLSEKRAYDSPFVFTTEPDCTNISLTTGNVSTEDGNYEFRQIKLEKGSEATPWTPAPEDLGLSYPDWVVNFAPSISENGILAPEFNEYPLELSGGRNLLTNRVENWEKRYWDPTSGVAAGGGSSHIRTKENVKILISPSTEYIFYGKKRLIALQYKEDNTYIGVASDTVDGTATRFTTHAEASYLRFYALSPVEDNNPALVTEYDFQLELGTTATPWSPTPEDLNLSYPNDIQNFGVSFADKHILAQQFNENENL